MSGDDRKLTYSERDRLRREGGGGPKSGRARADEETRSREALKAADSLFSDAPGGQEEKALATAVRAAHGTPELAGACRAYFGALGAPTSRELASIFLDADDKTLSIAVLDELLRQKQHEAGAFRLEGGLKRQVRILSEDFDDDLASRAEEILE
jgi:hypothetical protein